MALGPLDVHAGARTHKHTHMYTHPLTHAQGLHRPFIFYSDLDTDLPSFTKIDSRIDLNVKWQNTEFLEENSRKSR